MSVARTGVFIVGAKRTPIGTYGGKLKAMSATELAVQASKAAMVHANLNPSLVDETFMGNVMYTTLDSPYLSRHVALKAGAPLHTPALNINRQCLPC